MLLHWFDTLAARLPARCEVCRTWPAQPVCGDCLQSFAAPVARCPRCARPVDAHSPDLGKPCSDCLRAPPPLDRCHAALAYAFPWPQLIARFKFRAEPGWARTFAGLMRAAPGAAQALQVADRVLPLPLGPERLAQRGYNQALELARRLAPGKVDTRSLLRWRETDPQTSLDRSHRLGNVQGAFRVDPTHAARLRGTHLLLIDDVMTSGASLFAAAAALRRAGAASVSALVLARTPEA